MNRSQLHIDVLDSKVKDMILEDKENVTWNARDVLHVEKMLTSINCIE